MDSLIDGIPLAENFLQADTSREIGGVYYSRDSGLCEEGTFKEAIPTLQLSQSNLENCKTNEIHHIDKSD